MTSAVALFALTYGLIEANNYGWTSVRILSLFAIAAIALAVFIVLESRQRIPMLDLSLFRNRTFAGANATMMLVSLAMFGVFFFVSLYVQNVLGYSATQAGATFLPLTLLVVLTAPVAGRLSDRIGSRWLKVSGMTLLGCSLLLFSRLDQTSTFWTILPGLILGGLGMGLTMTPATAAAMGSVPVDKAGVGSAVLNSMRQVGGSLGLAVLGAIVASYVTVAPTDARYSAEFVTGFQRGLEVSAGIAFAAAILAVVTVRAVPDEAPSLAEASGGPRRVPAGR